MEIDKSLRNGTVMRYQSTNLLQVKSAVILLFGEEGGCMVEGILRRELCCSSVLLKWFWTELQRVNRFIFPSCSGVTSNMLFYFKTELICIFTLWPKSMQILYFGLWQFNTLNRGISHQPWLFFEGNWADLLIQLHVVALKREMLVHGALTPTGCLQHQNSMFGCLSMLELNSWTVLPNDLILLFFFPPLWEELVWHSLHTKI